MVFSFSYVSIGQVKDQFRDRENTSTIVVVKEDSAIDETVLNEYFDLADMSMSDQIMITTSSLPEATPVVAEVEVLTEEETEVEIETATASIDDEIETFFESIEEVDTEAEAVVTLETAPNIPTYQATNNQVETTPIVNTRRKEAPNRAKKSYAKKSSRKVKMSAKRKYFNKRKIKKNKRKRKFLNKKRRSNKCYSF